MHVTDALEVFLVQLQADGRSPHTIAQRRRHIRTFARWLEREERTTRLDRIDHTTIADFVSSPTARTTPDGRVKRATSANQMRTSLRAFFSYCHLAGLTDTNPAHLLRLARCASAPPRTLSEADQRRLLSALTISKALHARRDEMLIRVMLGTGLRLGSALALHAKDVDVERAEITVRRTKGDRPDTVVFGRELARHLARYLRERPAGPLFDNGHGQPLGARQARMRIAAWGVKAKLTSRLAPHQLRHTFGQSLYDRHHDLGLVQAALRHKAIASTTVYARASLTRVRQALG